MWLSEQQSGRGKNGQPISGQANNAYASGRNNGCPRTILIIIKLLQTTSSSPPSSRLYHSCQVGPVAAALTVLSLVSSYPRGSVLVLYDFLFLFFCAHHLFPSSSSTRVYNPIPS